ncbi:MAG: T9SS type A sorting domain-containing protein [Bacteroidales bacterium]|nr:T9SS type A sorting domain-containing protein [Bacteroidales bacterium]
MWGYSYIGGIYRSTDNAQTWEYLGLDEKPVYSIEVCTNEDIVTGVKNGIYKSNDDGVSWYQTYWPVGNITNILSLSNGYLFAGGVDNLHGIIRSNDFGETWDTVHVFNNYGQENLKALTVSAEGHLYAGTYNMFGEGSIWFTTDLGESWTEIDTPDFPPYWPWIFSLAVHPQGDLLVVFYGQGLYRYDFVTQQWGLLTYSWVTPGDILIIGDNKIYVGLYQDPNGSIGVIYSEDGGQNFSTLNSGMNGGNGASISYLFRHPSNFIYAIGNGFYRSTEPVYTAVINDIEPEPIQLRNFPNPFKKKTIISWDKSWSDKIVNLTIVNSSGNIVLKENIENTGCYTFKADIIEAGIYYYSIAGKEKQYSGKMICTD